MESHNIDWYFVFRDIPCYSPSNGIILPEVIKVSSNRRFQDYLYRDILMECEPYLSHTEQDLSYKQIEFELFFNNKLPLINNSGRHDMRQLESYAYLTANDVHLFLRSFEFILSRDFGITEPSQEQLNSLIQSYAGMLRRGFFCFYPFLDYQSEGMFLLPIAIPKSLLPGNNDDNTMAAKLKPYLPEYNASVIIPKRHDNNYPVYLMSWSAKKDW